MKTLNSERQAASIELKENESFEVTDIDGFPIFRIGSDGEVYTRRGIQRI